MNKKYKLIKSKEIKEIGSTAYLYEHIYTKAQILYLDNSDEIMTFAIGFRTPPLDSKGTPHILEHSVLSGSRKYKTKEPFMNMVNSSMQTFLNAMTFPDKTIYPVASRNTKDFQHLMDVYLDAVYFPAIYEDDRIFAQEGIHLEMEDMDSPIKYNGVVFNEMKGAYSDPESQVLEQLAHQLHPGSTYDRDSGGNPYHIVDLTSQELKDFHTRLYHPSNSYTVLSGDLDIEETLDYMDSEYLSHFEYTDPQSHIELGEQFSAPKTVEIDYSVAPTDSTENKNYLAYGVDLGDSTSPHESLLLGILQEILINHQSSVLQSELLKSDIGQDYYGYITSSLPLDLYFVAKNTKEGQLENYVELIEDKLTEVVEKGIDRDLVLGAINRREFALKDMGTNKGVYLAIMALDSWIYGTCPIAGLDFQKTFDDIKEGLDNRLIERYIQAKILDNPQKIYLEATPNPGKFAKKDKELEDKLETLKNSMTEEELENLVSKTKELHKYQLTPDTQEQKDTIPKLEKSDISSGVREINHTVDETDYTKIYVDEDTNGVYYTTIAFNLKNLKIEELPVAGLVIDLLGSLDTTNYSYKELSKEIGLHTGGISINTSSFEDIDKKDYTLIANIMARSVGDKQDKLHSLIEEIVLETQFDDLDRIQELITMRKAAYEGSVEQNGHRNIISTLLEKMTYPAYYSGQMGGNSYYKYISELVQNFDKYKDTLPRELETVYRKIFNTDIYLSIAGEKDQYEKGVEHISKLREQLSPYSEELTEPTLDRSSIGLKTSSNVVYVGQAFELDTQYTGTMAVLSKLISGGYLHTNIRAKGGAYGSGMGINRSGIVSLFSYRDPNLDQTYTVFENIIEEIENLELSERELTDYIISTMNSFDPPLSPSAYTGVVLNRYLSGTTVEEIELRKKEAINTTLEDLKSLAKPIKAGIKNSIYGVLGSRDIIEQSEKTLDITEDLFM